jgi:predicted RNase H-like HicB family nuclease
MNTINKLIGKKVKGFWFDDGIHKGLEYVSDMNRQIGKIGKIILYRNSDNSYHVEFEDDYWFYPAELIEQHLVKEKLKFSPIAMKCNQEQFDDVKPLLESDGCRIFNITNFRQDCYLVNNFNDAQNEIGNVDEDMIVDFNRKVYPEWNKKIFLNACGIEWEEPKKEVNCNYISVEFCEDNSLIGYYTDDKEVCAMGNTFDELLVKLQQAKKAIEESREKLAKEHPKVLSEDGNELLFDEKGNMIKKVESEEHNPLDDLPIIGDGVLMEVSNQGITWICKNVFAKYNNSFVAWTDHESTISIQLWEHARLIKPKTKITRKEFESKFEIID